MTADGYGTTRRCDRGGIARLTLDRAGRRNGLSMDVVGALTGHLARIAEDPSVRAVVLTGAHGDFSVGADLASPMESRAVRYEDPEEDAARLVQAAQAVRMLYELAKPTVAMVRGACAGGALSLAMACDLRYTADTAVFNTAFLSIALPGDYGLTWVLNRVVGPARAKELMLLPGRMAADQAEHAGLVNGVHPEAELESRVEEVARRLADSSPAAVTALKRNLTDATTASLEEFLPVEAARLVGCAHSADAAEARAAFLEKRPPRFTGR
ncbi:enoyl-CoA hydratase-related protein [Peterkaempfera sp. SMS 1(5)a]|uniref:enoyl-CoA hydratase-related protein n=1 Tax=Peterkaempfera podocarpi TaxID=3232308 RepID=UPI00366B31C6